MKTLQDFLTEEMQDPEFRAVYEALEPEFTIVQALIDARKQNGMTQQQLAERSGIAQSDISKIERGDANPSLRTLKRLAAGMGTRLKLDFQPVAHTG
jgi:DNA-binding XRE family transcriptional regulator